MKKLILFLFIFSFNLSAAVKYLPGTYQVDPDHTRVGFTIEPSYPTMTIKDVTKKVTFSGHYTGAMKDHWGNDRVALNLSGKINRRDFHIDYNSKYPTAPEWETWSIFRY